MKKKIVTAIAAASIVIGISAMSASAWNHTGYMNNGYGMMNGPGVAGTANQKFLVETKEARLAIAADQAELSALMAGPSPDSKRVRELSENIAANQLALEEKSRGYGYSGNGGGHMRGHGMQGHGNMNGGYHGRCMW